MIHLNALFPSRVLWPCVLIFAQLTVKKKRRHLQTKNRTHINKMGGIISLSSLACCFTSAACSAGCSVCSGLCKNSTMAKLMYAVLLLSTLVVSCIMLSPGVQGWLTKVNIKVYMYICKLRKGQSYKFTRILFFVGLPRSFAREVKIALFVRSTLSSKSSLYLKYRAISASVVMTKHSHF